MTPDERSMLTELANKIAQTPAPPRDPDAEELIRSRIGNRPDALYLMTQTVLIQNMALQQAQKQIQELQQGRAAGGSSSSSSFLGQSGASSYSAPAPPSSQYASQPQYAQQPQFVQPMTTPAAGAAPSFLKGAAQTAAGVAAGALAFEGIRSMFSHPGYGMGGVGLGGFGDGGMGGFGGRPVEETVINNYYDGPGGSGTGAGGDDLRLGDNRDNFAETNSADAGQYEDASVSDDSSAFDTLSDGGYDDSGDSFS